MNLLYNSQHAFIAIMIINITANIKLRKSKNLISMIIKFARIKIRPWVFGNLNHRHSTTSLLHCISWYNVFWNVHNHITIYVNKLHQLADMVTQNNALGLHRGNAFTTCTKYVQIWKPHCFGLYFMWNNIMEGKFRNSVRL